MPKRIITFGFLVFCLSCSGIFAEEDHITITTYYPSPYGSYRELTAWRMKIGKDYARSGTSIEDNNFIVQGNMGIGTSSATEKLEVVGKIKIVDQANPAQLGYVLTADANGVGTWQQPGGGGRYDSGWFAIGSNSSRTLEHNLGTTGLYWEIWAASDASGSNKNRQVYTSARYGSAMTGAYITVINANSFKLQTVLC
jgi:hypothetical protein